MTELARGEMLTLARHLSEECSALMSEAEQERHRAVVDRGDYRRAGRGKEAAALASHAQALGVLKAIDILDRETPT